MKQLLFLPVIVGAHVASAETSCPPTAHTRIACQISAEGVKLNVCTEGSGIYFLRSSLAGVSGRVVGGGSHGSFEVTTLATSAGRITIRTPEVEPGKCSEFMRSTVEIAGVKKAARCIVDKRARSQF